MRVLPAGAYYASSAPGARGSILTSGADSSHGGVVTVAHTPLTTWRRSPRANASTVAMAMRSMLEAASGVL